MGKFWTEGSICLEVLQTGFKIIFWFLCFHFSPSVRCVGCCAASGLSQDSPRRPTWYLFLKPSLQARCGLVHDATNVWSSTATWTENASSGVLQVSMNGALSSSCSRFWAEFQESYSKVNFPPAGSQSGTRLTRTGEEQIGWGRVELGPVVEPLSRWIQCLVDAADGLCLPAGCCWSTSLASSSWSSWSSSGWRGSFEQPPMFQSPPEQSLICNYLSANLNRWDVALLESDSLWLELVGDLEQNAEPIHFSIPILLYLWSLSKGEWVNSVKPESDGGSTRQSYRSQEFLLPVGQGFLTILIFQVEWLTRHLDKGEDVWVSLHSAGKAVRVQQSLCFHVQEEAPGNK